MTKYNSLRVKINSAIIITFLVIALIFSTILTVFEIQRRANVIKQVKITLNDLMIQKKQQLGEEIFNGHKRAITASLKEIMKREMIVAISTYDLDGFLLVSTADEPPHNLSKSELVSLDQSATFIEQDWKNQPILQFTSKIEAYGEDVGYWKVRYSLASLRQETYKIIGIFAALLLTMLLIMSGLLNILLSRLVLKPVYFLRNAMQRVKEGKLGEQVPLISHDEIGDMAQTFNKMSSVIAITTSTFEKFVPKQFLDRIAKNGIDSIKRGMVTSDYTTILFNDIRSFTTISEMMPPKDIFGFLNTYLAHMNLAISKYNGYVDKFIGDGIMALFDQKTGTNQQGAISAINSAIEMLLELKNFNEFLRTSGKAPITTGTGIHSGQVTIGTLGSDTRMDTTAIGDAVNVASRLESLTKFYGCQIIISSTTYELLEYDDKLFCRELGYVVLKGKVKPISIFEVFNANPDEIQELKHQILKPYQEALTNFHIRKWDQAIKLFNQCLRIYPEDSVSKIYLNRSHLYKETPPSDDWNGALILEHK